MYVLSRRTGLSVGLALLATAVLFVFPATAAEQEKTNTVMTVGEMCGGCVKKITKRFDGVEGIAKVQCNIEKKICDVDPRKGRSTEPQGRLGDHGKHRKDADEDGHA